MDSKTPAELAKQLRLQREVSDLQAELLEIERKKSKPKRDRGEGSVFYYPGKHRWLGVITVGYDNGKRITRTVAAIDKASALKRLAKLKTENLQGTPHKSNITLGEHLDSWLAERLADGHIQATTHELYRAAIAKHIKPKLGLHKLQAIQLHTMRSFFQQLQKSHIGTDARITCYRVLRPAFDDAVAQQLLAANPMTTLKQPRLPHRQMMVWNEVDARHFLAVAKTDRLYALYCVALLGGLRIGEIQALTWGDVDFKHDSIRINKTLACIKSKLVPKPTKTKSSNRVVVLPERAMMALQEHKRLREVELKRDTLPSEIVFIGERNHSYLRKENIAFRSFHPLAKLAGLEKPNQKNLRFHDLRHTHACLLLAGGVVPNVVSARLGHKSVAFTMAIYAHVLPSMDDKAITVLKGI